MVTRDSLGLLNLDISLFGLFDFIIGIHLGFFGVFQIPFPLQIGFFDPGSGVFLVLGRSPFEIGIFLALLESIMVEPITAIIFLVHLFLSDTIRVFDVLSCLKH